MFRTRNLTPLAALALGALGGWAAANVRFDAPLRAEQVPAGPQEGGKKPNILVIFGDDIGITNLSAYSGGLMGYETPNIDRIAREGIRFLH